MWSPVRRAFARGPRVILALIAICVLLSGAERWPTGHWEGGPIEPIDGSAVVVGPADTEGGASGPSSLRLATFNIHSCVGNDGKWDVGRTAELLRGYDLVSLHEVRGEGPWWEDNAQAIGERLNVRSLFAPTEVWWWTPWFGNGVLTRTRIEHWQCDRLPSGFREAYRQVLYLNVPFGKGTLNVLMAHLGKKENRAKQFPMVAEQFLRLPEPAVLMGDFNTRPWDPLMQKLLREPGVEDPVGKRLTYPRDRVDYILLKGLKWKDAGLVENKMSDHPVIWVEIEAP